MKVASKVSLVASLLISGCVVAPGAPFGGTMALDRSNTLVQTAASISTTQSLIPALDTPVTKAPGTAIGTSSGGGGSASQVPGNRLKVDLRGFLAAFKPASQRRVLATVADIAQLVLTIQQPGQPDKTATLTQADLASGVAEFTFSNLPEGNAIVFVVAYNAAHVPIGSAAQVVVISSGAAASADMTIQLVPSTAPPGPGGTLITKTTILDGAPPPPPPSGTVLGEYVTGGLIHRLIPGPDRTMFVASSVHSSLPGSSIIFAFWNSITRLADDGTSLFEYVGPFIQPAKIAFSSTTNTLVTPLANGRFLGIDGSPSAALGLPQTDVTFNPQGTLYYSQVSAGVLRVYKYPPNGTAVATSMEGGGPIGFDVAGDLWVGAGSSTSGTLKHYDQDEHLLGTTAVAGPIKSIHPAPNGDLWVLHAAQPGAALFMPDQLAPKLSRISAQGEVVTTLNVSSRQIAFDAEGNIWSAGENLAKLSPEGDVLATFPFNSTAVAVDESGIVWVGLYGVSAPSPNLRKIQP